MSQTLLEEYIQNGNITGLRELLKETPLLASRKTSHQISPLMLSLYYKKPEVARLLLDYVLNVSFFEASALGKLEQVAQYLFEDPTMINNFSEDGFTALGLAAYFGQEEVTRYLLLKGADPNVPSANGFQVYPIHSAAATKHNPIVKLLLEAGARVNVIQQQGITPLHSAAHHGNIELLIELLEAGADVQAKMEDGRTPADMAAGQGFSEIAKILAD